MIFKDSSYLYTDRICKFQFCQFCPLYECELVEEYMKFVKRNVTDAGENVDPEMEEFIIEDPKVYLSYNVKAGNFPCDVSDLNGIDCGTKRVSEGIGNHYKIQIKKKSGKIETEIKNRWEPSQAIFISAQTGKGKNWFVEDKLIPYVRALNHETKSNYKILIISNRLALRQQIRNHLNGQSDLNNENESIYSYKKYADIMTYQSILYKKKFLEQTQKSSKSRYIYVICDEAHFFISDAMFNPYTSKILKALIKVFNNAIRVYMSATPYECVKYIYKHERKILDSETADDYDNIGSDFDQMVFYHFKRDYSYLDTKAYSKIEEL